MCIMTRGRGGRRLVDLVSKDREGFQKLREQTVKRVVCGGFDQRGVKYTPRTWWDFSWAGGEEKE